VPRIHLIARHFAALALCTALAAFAATPITGTVTNKTTNKPSAGDTVTLIRLAQGMQEANHTTTDARGHYTLAVVDDGLHLIRVTHEKATYFQPVMPNVHSIDVDVYEAAPRVEGVSTSVEELHVEATPTALHIVEVLEVMNQSSPQRTQFGPKGFDFFLPPNAHIVRAGAMRDQLPVPAAAVPVGDNPGHYTFIFPIRPGETQFGILYDLPYTGSAGIPLHVTSDVATLAVVLPSSITFTPGRGAPFTQQPASAGAAQTQTWTAQNVTPSQTLDFSVSGTGSLPSQAAASSQGSDNTQPASSAGADTRPGIGLGNPLDQNGTHDPWSKYKWWILSGLALLLAAAAGILLRKPSADSTTPLPQPHPPAVTPQTHSAQLLAALKEELFALETDHLQRRISDEDYLAHKAALELVLRRALDRSAAPQPNPELISQ
jgi:hypothetical protein